MSEPTNNPELPLEMKKQFLQLLKHQGKEGSQDWTWVTNDCIPLDKARFNKIELAWAEMWDSNPGVFQEQEVYIPRDATFLDVIRAENKQQIAEAEQKAKERGEGKGKGKAKENESSTIKPKEDKNIFVGHPNPVEKDTMAALYHRQLENFRILTLDEDKAAHTKARRAGDEMYNLARKAEFTSDDPEIWINFKGDQDEDK